MARAFFKSASSARRILEIKEPVFSSRDAMVPSFQPSDPIEFRAAIVGHGSPVARSCEFLWPRLPIGFQGPERSSTVATRGAMSSLHICIISQRFPTAGFLWAVAQGLTQHGHRVTVLTQRNISAG